MCGRVILAHASRAFNVCALSGRRNSAEKRGTVGTGGRARTRCDAIRYVVKKTERDKERRWSSGRIISGACGGCVPLEQGAAGGPAVLRRSGAGVSRTCTSLMAVALRTRGGTAQVNSDASIAGGKEEVVGRGGCGVNVEWQLKRECELFWGFLVSPVPNAMPPCGSETTHMTLDWRASLGR